MMILLFFMNDDQVIVRDMNGLTEYQITFH